MCVCIHIYMTVYLFSTVCSFYLLLTLVILNVPLHHSLPLSSDLKTIEKLLFHKHLFLSVCPMTSQKYIVPRLDFILRELFSFEF